MARDVAQDLLFLAAGRIGDHAGQVVEVQAQAARAEGQRRLQVSVGVGDTRKNKELKKKTSQRGRGEAKRKECAKPRKESQEKDWKSGTSE